MKSKIRLNTTIETESPTTRVALHPFLAGMDRTQLALLTDCAMAAHFETGQTNLVRRRRSCNLLAASAGGTSFHRLPPADISPPQKMHTIPQEVRSALFSEVKESDI